MKPEIELSWNKGGSKIDGSTYPAGYVYCVRQGRASLWGLRTFPSKRAARAAALRVLEEVER